MDADSVAVFQQLIDMADAGELHAPLFLVLAIRSTEVDVEAEAPWKGMLARDNVQRLDIGKLDERAAVELVQATTLGGNMSDAVTAYILAHCAGNPLQIEQMTTSLFSSNVLFLNDKEVYECEGDIDSVRTCICVPPPLQIHLACPPALRVHACPPRVRV